MSPLHYSAFPSQAQKNSIRIHIITHSHVKTSITQPKRKIFLKKIPP